ncbi:hypothetical protein BT93_H2484 [Corymbia citriodora subsp. variegata]|nr:hypothetical protein BT93_H2484 [Corymbia citriodora subsp. variegata]
MAVMITVVVDGLGTLARAIWGLQDRRVSATFEAVSSAASSVGMAFLLCFLSGVHRHHRGGLGLALM